MKHLSLTLILNIVAGTKVFMVMFLKRNTD